MSWIWFALIIPLGYLAAVVYFKLKSASADYNHKRGRFTEEELEAVRWGGAVQRLRSTLN